MRLRLFLLLFAIVLSNTALVGSGAAATLYGLHMDMPWSNRDDDHRNAVQLAKAINAQVSRNSFLWHLIEPVRGTRNWTVPDAVVNRCIEAGIEPLFAIYGSPAWANGTNTATSGYYLYVPTSAAAFDAWVREYKSFVSEAVARYRGRVKKWELWNEQNEHYFWKPQPNVDQYVRWYREMYSAIKAQDPSAEVALGGLVALCCSSSLYNGRQFLQELYARNVYPDIVAIHPYAMQNQAPDAHIQWENNFDDIQLIYDTMKAGGQTKTPIWVTEWGWDTTKITESLQAQYVERSLEMIRDRYPFVTLATYFIDYDRPNAYYHGLYTGTYRMKEAGARFRDFVAGSGAPSPPTNLRFVQ